MAEYQEIEVGKIEELDNGEYDFVLIAIKEGRYLFRFFLLGENRFSHSDFAVG